MNSRQAFSRTVSSTEHKQKDSHLTGRAGTESHVAKPVSGKKRTTVMNFTSARPLTKMLISFTKKLAHLLTELDPIFHTNINKD